MAEDREQPLWMPITTVFVIIMKTGHQMLLPAEDPETLILVAKVRDRDRERDREDVARARVVEKTLSTLIKMEYATIR